MQHPRPGTVTGFRQDIAGGLNPTKPIAGADMVALMRLLEQKAQDSIRVQSINPLMEFVYSSLSAGARFIDHVPLACAKGCSFCCRTWVDATPPEVLFTIKGMGPTERAVAGASIDHFQSLTAGAGFSDRRGKANPPCPLLDSEGACSVYASRPLTCRTVVSTDAQACKLTFIDGSDIGFPSPRVWFVLRDSYTTALEGALIRAGLAYRARELGASLKVAFDTPDAEQRWLSGADDFTAAPVSPAPAIFASPMWSAIYWQAFGALPTLADPPA